LLRSLGVDGRDARLSTDVTADAARRVSTFIYSVLVIAIA